MYFPLRAVNMSYVRHCGVMETFHNLRRIRAQDLRSTAVDIAAFRQASSQSFPQSGKFARHVGFNILQSFDRTNPAVRLCSWLLQPEFVEVRTWEVRCYAP